MALPDPNKVWALFMSDPLDFILMFAAVIVVVAGFSWWLRGHIIKERLAAKDEQINLAKAQRDELAAKVGDGERKLSEIKGQISAKASASDISAAVTSAEGLFRDARIIIEVMGVTLSSIDTRYGGTPVLPSPRHKG
jgi:hypothetical protein